MSENENFPSISIEKIKFKIMMMYSILMKMILSYLWEQTM